MLKYEIHFDQFYVKYDWDGCRYHVSVVPSSYMNSGTACFHENYYWWVIQNQTLVKRSDIFMTIPVIIFQMQNFYTVHFLNLRLTANV